MKNLKIVYVLMLLCIVLIAIIIIRQINVNKADEHSEVEKELNNMVMPAVSNETGGEEIYSNSPVTSENITSHSTENMQENNSYKELEDVEIDYDLSKMVEDKCYIILKPNIVYNIAELDNFINNIEKGEQDKIRIVQYTTEGQPILSELEYKDNKFVLKIDNRRDGYASAQDKKITTTEYDATKYKLVKENEPKDITDKVKYYQLELKELDTNKTIPICEYAQINRSSNENFKIEFNQDIENKIKVLGAGEKSEYDYNIYSYKGTVDVVINGEKMSLRDALINNKITVDEILEKANKDVEDGIIFGDGYLDGGSRIYIYDDYSIIKLNTLDGNKDLYIGLPSMNINDIK